MGGTASVAVGRDQRSEGLLPGPPATAVTAGDRPAGGRGAALFLKQIICGSRLAVAMVARLVT